MELVKKGITMAFGKSELFHNEAQSVLYKKIEKYETCKAAVLLKDKDILKMVLKDGETKEDATTKKVKHRLGARIKILKQRLEERGWHLPSDDYGE